MKHISIILIVFTSFFGFSQEQKTSFSLQEAIDYALENNNNAKNAALNIEVAKQQKWATTATGLPQVNGEVAYQNWIKQQVSLLPGEIIGAEPGTFVPVTFSTKHSLSATATLTQQLFNGSYLVGLQSAKVYLEISENAKVKTDLEIRKAVINAYGNVLLANESETVLDRNISVLQKTLNETTQIYKNGLGEEESVEQLQITLSSLESQLKNVKRLQQLAYQMLNITLGLDANTDSSITDSLENLALENTNLELLTASDNVESTIDYKIAENDKTSKELLLKLEKSKALPTLNAFINAGYSGFNDEFKFLRSSQQWFGSSLFGATMSIPIFSSGMRKANTQMAQINLEQAENNLNQTKQQLQLEIASAKSEYQLAIEELENKKQNLSLAERIEKKNQTKFFEGIGSSFELRQAQTQLYQAQNELLQAMLDVINNKATLETVLNTTN